ncbi:alpha/beta-hydrolase [Saitoella complicata NRRL Y-17804]|uniref:alpha/beta-hydrolase n=1 Tax=Saitoella complicata (strain BCRC 22490 / CBS 7301 / JCM 7358 / NBRC 10748 / NRRL Y-17804) TaxID=698492 RepID=UPI0008673D48|nr:alpha/beta-hydrolase [Saitoella complicata NRRL Y-17804]ODQ49925.1 alpha/beta-hydrolase [Saitoella complicata NRRL Y-17804]
MQTSHPRLTPLSTFSPTDHLLLSTLRFIPTTTSPGPFTFIFLHATGLQSSTFEPLIATLFDSSIGRNIKEVWAIDAANQGDSAVLNDGKLGVEYSWADGARDITSVIKQANLTEPIVLVGHSMGGAQALLATILHPTLIHATIALEPVAHNAPISTPPTLLLHNTLRKPSSWPSRTDTSLLSLRQKSFYRRWDQRVWDIWLETALHQNEEGGQVRLKTTPIQEAACYLDPTTQSLTFSLLPHMRRPVLYVVGGAARWNTAQSNVDRQGRTPGARTVVVEGGGHLVCVEDVQGTVDAMVPFLTEVMDDWTENSKQTHNPTNVPQWRERRTQELLDGFRKILEAKIGKDDAAKAKITKSML